MPEKMEKMWNKTVFEKNDPGEHYCEMIIREGSKAPLIDLPDDTAMPSYYDKKLFRKAQDFYQEYRVFISTTNVLGVMILFGVESILDILVCTKQSSTPVTAYKRYAETILYINNLYDGDPEDPTSKCFRSLLAIRKKHKHGSLMGQRRVNKFINQRDMAITQNSFMGHVMAYHSHFGITSDTEKLFALCHFWRVIGYMIGIEDRYNLCNGDLETVTSKCQAIFRHIIVPGMLNSPQDEGMMTEAFFKGLLGLSTEFEPEKFIFITKRMTMVPGYYMSEDECQKQLEYVENYPQYIPNTDLLKEEMAKNPTRSKSFGMLKRSFRWDLIFTDYLLVNIVPKSAMVRGVFNFINSARLFFLKHLPVLAIWKFGYKNAFVRVLED